MRAFRIDFACGLGALAVIAAAGPALAQVGAPVSLLPQAAPPPESGGSSGAAPAAPAAAPIVPDDGAWAGGIGPDMGGFPSDMWQGTGRSFVAAALPLLQPSISPVLQDLARRLLISSAASPEGPDAPDRPSLAAARIDRLLALGDVPGAIGLMDGLPSDPSGDGMDRTRVELRFAANDVTGACAAVTRGVARYQSAWWARALIACQALEGQSEEASLGLSLLPDEKTQPDPGFDALIAAVGGEHGTIDKLGDPDPMRMALLAAAKAPLPRDALAAAGPAALLAYATNEKAPLDARLSAGEAAGAVGALSPEGLAALYRSVPATEDAESGILKDENGPQNPKTRAILFQIARSSAPTVTREAAMAIFIADAKKRELFPLAARLLAPAIIELTPTDASPNFAADAARTLLLAGDVDRARPWIDAAGEKPLVLLSRLGRSGGNDEGDATPLLHDAIAALATRDAAAAVSQADLLLELVAAFGIPVSGLDWAPLMAPPHDASIPNAALWLDQQQAMTGKRLGETVLASILLAQSGDKLSLEPVVLGRAIEGLRAVGLDSDARALAIEAAVDAGI
jgi:hypothetical protein